MLDQAIQSFMELMIQQAVGEIETTQVGSTFEFTEQLRRTTVYLARGRQQRWVIACAAQASLSAGYFQQWRVPGS